MYLPQTLPVGMSVSQYIHTCWGCCQVLPHEITPKDNGVLRWGGIPVAHLSFRGVPARWPAAPAISVFVVFPASWTLLSWSSLSFFLVEPILHYLPEKGWLAVNSETATTWNVCSIITVSDSVIEHRILCWGIIVSFEFWKHYSIAFNSKKYKVVLIPDPLVRSLFPYFPGAQGLPSISKSHNQMPSFVGLIHHRGTW